ncbi:hypothetical protein BJI67_16390 (plasmid) [Acidihalobacter aeolianus]|uniref:Uncharacterized protein n=1 Tax=Acidihalobacter aeolianus TaxID=2792603 RepID=A0A1D8KCY1_9GAMM|nr:hypothetical protein BJI67_16390 [Acidihalobacter aeolianus]
MRVPRVLRLTDRQAGSRSVAGQPLTATITRENLTIQRVFNLLYSPQQSRPATAEFAQDAGLGLLSKIRLLELISLDGIEGPRQFQIHLHGHMIHSAPQ